MTVKVRMVVHICRMMIGAVGKKNQNEPLRRFQKSVSLQVKLPATIMQQDKSTLHGQLRREIEQALGFSLKTPKDFETFGDVLFEHQHVHVSVSTLKRYWGYVKVSGSYSPNRYTLRILARYAGYADWEAFERGEKPVVNDNEKEKRRMIDASLLQIEECLNIIYKEMNTLRSLTGEAETDAILPAADVAHGD